MAVTRDRATSYREGVEVEFPVATGAKIYAGTMFVINAAGYAISGDNVIAGCKFGGVALEQVDNTNGQNGDLVVRGRQLGVFDFKATSIAQANLKSDMYIVDAETFDESDPGHGVKCGKLVKYVSATRGWLQIDVALATAIAGAADALTVSDAGDFFAAAKDTVAEQVQELAGELIPVYIPRQSGWVKDGTDKQAVGPKLELNFPCRIKRYYGHLGTAPGAGKTLAVKHGATTLASFVDAAVDAEGEALDIAVAANTDFFGAAGLLLNETAAGAGDNLDGYFLVARDDGE